MKNINILLLLIFILGTGLVTTGPNYKLKVFNHDNGVDSTNKLSDTSITKYPKFNQVYKSFKHYNPNLDSSTVYNFLDVCRYYGFDKNDHILNMCVGQILVESGSKHFKNGKINIGSGGHVGISQISPKWGFAIMTKTVSYNDFVSIKEILGDSLMVKPNTYTKSFEWLSIERNNLAFWGHMINNNLISVGKIDNAMVRYNAGGGGYNNYINSGAKISNHHYIKAIRTKLAAIK